ncbi:ATP-binding protein [Rhizobium sp. XQZ8]|uniref:AAA family ATPase n=1 Tax=Rhizobium populisoli TaxID=2859785 RepID=UPI001C66B129|nr:ATP-binding protein [Rhizobium populisoli]MBW6424179.1 ATP-binding protein [Rhizobium populisoli]
MTSARQIIAMIRSHAAGDNEKFLAIAETIAADAGKSGKSKVADDIRSVITDARQSPEPRHTSHPVPITAPRGELAGLVRASYPETYLADLVLNGDLMRRINRAVREHRERDILTRNGLTPRRKYLFSGPPGTGKGMTAAAVASELNLPLFTILLDGVITKFMGETASKLRLVFDSMRVHRGVYFFDEVDALASRRDADNDIGEARRMLNSFLQFLEDDQSSSVIIAATNHKVLLDHAIFRRFDASFQYSKPSPEEAQRVLKFNLTQFDHKDIDWDRVVDIAMGLSQADLVAVAADAARDAVLDNDGRLTADILFHAITDRNTIHPD